MLSIDQSVANVLREMRRIMNSVVEVNAKIAELEEQSMRWKKAMRAATLAKLQQVLRLKTADKSTKSRNQTVRLTERDLQTRSPANGSSRR